MKTTIEAPFQLSDNFRGKLEVKCKSLAQYNKSITQVNVFFKEDDGQGNNDVLAEIRVRVPGSDLFASNADDNATRAFSKAYDSVKRQVRKRKDMVKDHYSEVKEINEIVNNTY